MIKGGPPVDHPLPWIDSTILVDCHSWEFYTFFSGFLLIWGRPLSVICTSPILAHSFHHNRPISWSLKLFPKFHLEEFEFFVEEITVWSDPSTDHSVGPTDQICAQNQGRLGLFVGFSSHISWSAADLCTLTLSVRHTAPSALWITFLSSDLFIGIIFLEFFRSG